MSDTNTKTGNKLNENSLMNYFNNNSLSHIMYDGPGGIPYAAIGMVTIAAGVFSYVTYADYTQEAEAEAAQRAEEDQSDNMFSSIYGGDDQNATEPEFAAQEATAPEDEEATAPEDEEATAQEDEESTAPEDLDSKEQESISTKAEEPGEKFKLGGKKSLKKRSSEKRKSKNDRKQKTHNPSKKRR